MAYSKNKIIQIILLSAVIFLNPNVSHSSTGDSTSQPPAFVQFFLNVSNAIGQAIHDNIPNKREFYGDVQEYNGNTTGKLKGFLGGLTRIFQGYSEDDSGLEGSSHNFFNNLSQFIENSWNNILAFPMLAKITNLIQPMFDEAIANFKSTLPRTHGDGNTPLSTFNNFYYEMAQNNPNDLGPLFDVDPYTQSKMTTVNSDIQETNQHGRVKFDIHFKDTKEYTDRELTQHELIIKNKLVKNFEKPEDLTILHSMPDQMRKDGVDENIVNFVQEELHYINWLLVKAHNENGLIVDTNHPQMQYPRGYSMRKFFNNFLAILKDWHNNTSKTLYAWTQKLKV